MIWLLIFVPMLAVVAVGLGTPRRRLGAAGALTMVVTALLGLGAALWQSEASLSWGGGLELRFAVIDAARVLVVLVPVIAAPVVAFAAWEYADDPGLRRLVGLLLGFVGAMELLVVAADLVSLLIGWELVAAFSWALIAHRWRETRPSQAALDAYVTVRLGGVGLLIAAGAVFASTGSLDYATLGGAPRPWLDIAAAGILFAAMAKSAQVPFSQWLFSAMEGPAPVSALLHSATMVAAGAYVLIRLAPLFAPLGWFGPAIAVIGTISALSGGVVASLQTDFKRVLAGSTTAQYGLMFIAIGAGSTTAALAQLMVHAFFKSLLFLGAGVALASAGTGDLARLRLGSSKRVVALLFGVGVLALGAVPILGGGISKEAIISAGMEYSLWLGAGVLVIGFMSAFYGGRLFLLAFGPSDDDPPGAIRTPALFRSGPPARGRIVGTEIWTMGFLAATSVLLVLLRVPAVWRALELVTLPRRIGEHFVHIALSLLASAVAFAAVVVLDRRGLLLSLGLAPATQAKVSDWLGFPTVVRRGITEPVFALARLLRRLDDHVIDAGVWGVAASVVRFAGRIRLLDERVVDGAVRGVGRFAIRSSGRIRLLDERVVDGAVRGVATLGMLGATMSGVWDDRGFDGAVEGIARASWWSGKQVRRLQTGLTHHYYVIVAAGLVLAVAVAAIRS